MVLLQVANYRVRVDEPSPTHHGSPAPERPWPRPGESPRTRFPYLSCYRESPLENEDRGVREWWRGLLLPHTPTCPPVSCLKLHEPFRESWFVLCWSAWSEASPSPCRGYISLTNNCILTTRNRKGDGRQT